jgi:O-antigen/teichoic acid export membrane protein
MMYDGDWDRPAARRYWYRVEDLLERVVPLETDVGELRPSGPPDWSSTRSGRHRAVGTAAPSTVLQPTVTRLRSFYRDSLLRNSLFVFLATSAMAVLGFAFFIAAARLYSPNEVGEGTSFISGTGLISYFALLGLNVTIVRFLPFSTRPSDDINTSLLLVFLAGLVLSTGYLVLLPVVAPNVASLQGSPVKSAAFILLSAMVAVNVFADSVFVAYRSTAYSFVVSGVVQGSTKIVLLVVLVGVGSFGLPVSTGAAASVAASINVTILIRRFGLRLRPWISRAVMRRIFGFSSAHYLANLCNIVPPLVLPVVVVQQLGQEAGGYFYVTFMISNLLYGVAYAICQSLFAEASHGEESIGRLARKAAIALAATTLPASALIISARTLLLSSFGGVYAERAADTLVVLAAAAPVVALYVLATSLMRVMTAPYLLIVVNFVFAAGILGMAITWSGHGLVGISMGWLLGHAGGAVLAGATLLSARRRVASGPMATFRKGTHLEDYARHEAISGRGRR